MGTKSLLLLIVWIGILQATAIAQTQKDTDTKTRGEKEEAVAEALIRQRVEDLCEGDSREGHRPRHVSLCTQHRFIRSQAAPALRRD